MNLSKNSLSVIVVLVAGVVVGFGVGFATGRLTANPQLREQRRREEKVRDACREYIASESRIDIMFSGIGALRESGVTKFDAMRSYNQGCSEDFVGEQLTGCLACGVAIIDALYGRPAP